MDLLEKERRERLYLEVFACELIKAAYRGYYLRKRYVKNLLCLDYQHLRRCSDFVVLDTLRNALDCNGAFVS